MCVVVYFLCLDGSIKLLPNNSLFSSISTVVSSKIKPSFISVFIVLQQQGICSARVFLFDISLFLNLIDCIVVRKFKDQLNISFFGLDLFSS